MKFEIKVNVKKNSVNTGKAQKAHSYISGTKLQPLWKSMEGLFSFFLRKHRNI